MDADFSVELGGEDPVLDFPWTDASGRLAYFDLKRHPELLAQVEETRDLPELAEFLRSVNSARSVVESAKCDVWTTMELTPEEKIFGASHKFASYVDLVLSNADQRHSFPEHLQFAKRLAALLRSAPETSSSAEVCVRRCFLSEGGEAREGFYFTVYVNGYENDEAVARQNWAIGMKLVGNAIVQLSGRDVT
ncbi:MAG: hypothetical protein LAO22_16650 [Acidobacteriia bacterium]|nr:hypothetical protein [Terriglobia bacterium]